MPLDGSTIFDAQPGPQTALLKCPAEEIFFGGARGGGKTAGAIGMWLQHMMEYGAAAQGIFFRRRYRDLEGALLQMRRFFGAAGGVWRAAASTWHFPNGAQLRLRHLWDERDAEAYQGHEYSFLCFEEAGQWPTAKPVDMLRATLRGTLVQGQRRILLLTGNPGGAGHGWLKQRYVTPSRRGFRLIADPETGQTRCFIPSKLDDNRILLAADPYYSRNLQRVGSRQLVRAWLEGDWDVVAGGAFDEVWQPERQVLPIEFAPPPGWTWRRAFDWGSSKPSALGVWAISDGTQLAGWDGPHFPKGSMVLMRELYTVRRDDAGDPLPNVGAELPNPKLGEAVAQACTGLRFRESVADPSIWNRMGGLSILEQMAQGAKAEGDPWQWIKADNQRVAGWQRMRTMLGHSASERPEGPGIWITEGCSEWLRTVPVMQRDPKKPDDVDTEAEDHHADATRYAAQAGISRVELVAPVMVR